MDQQAVITEIEERARALGLSMSEVCKRANLHPTTFSRWKLSEKNPHPTGANFGSLTKIEAVLAAAEGSVGAEGSPTPQGIEDDNWKPSDDTLIALERHLPAPRAAREPAAGEAA